MSNFFEDITNASKGNPPPISQYYTDLIKAPFQAVSGIGNFTMDAVKGVGNLYNKITTPATINPQPSVQPNQPPQPSTINTNQPVISPNHKTETVVKTTHTPIINPQPVYQPGQSSNVGGMNVGNFGPSGNMGGVGTYIKPGTFDTQNDPGVGIPSSTGFNPPPINGQVTSDYLSNKNTYFDLLDKQRQYQQDYVKQLNDYNNLVASDKMNANKALYSGDTVDYGLGVAGLTERTNALKEAAAAAGLQGAAKLVDFGGTNISQYFTGQQNTRANAPTFENLTTSPTGDVYATQRDPVTGQTSLIGLGNIYNGTFNNPQSQGGTAQPTQAINPSLKQNNDGTFTLPDGGVVNPVYAQKISTLPNAYQPFVSTGPQGVAYINLDKISQLPTGVQGDIQRKASELGIPVLDTTQSAGLQSVYSLYNTLDLMQNLVDTTLRPGVLGKGIDTLESFVNKFVQYKPILQNFDNLRTLAGQADTNLMGGIGSGFRQNTANLGVSIQNLPVPSDNKESATVKINATRALLDAAMSKTFPAFSGSGSILSNGQNSVGKQNATPVIINTSVGPINASF